MKRCRVGDLAMTTSPESFGIFVDVVEAPCGDYKFPSGKYVRACDPLLEWVVRHRQTGALAVWPDSELLPLRPDNDEITETTKELEGAL